MQTKLDHITDDQIECAAGALGHIPDLPYSESWSDVGRVAHLAWWMGYMKSWIGWPVTFFDAEGLHFDGHHRVRACKFLARRRGIQIQIPVRYDPLMPEMAPSQTPFSTPSATLFCRPSNKD